ncbi:MAG TPA: hypothetical protein VHM70_31845 [Polyangiaceae bacterium]|nr:hypothetical protein [Polyangiaceae bacterium]
MSTASTGTGPDIAASSAAPQATPPGAPSTTSTPSPVTNGPQTTPANPPPPGTPGATTSTPPGPPSDVPATTGPGVTPGPTGTDITAAGGAPATEPTGTSPVDVTPPAPTGTDPAPAVSVPMGASDHCLYGFDPLPNDDTMKAGPAIFQPSGGGEKDTTVQPEVLQWMDENKWTGAHVVWHAVRGCKNGSAGGLLSPLGYPNICQDYPFLVPSDQNCASDGDGYQFLLFHRHMLKTLQQLWPKHADDFAGFPKFPTTKEELPEVWNEKDPNWSATILAAAEIGDDIENNLDLFPDEGALGFWLQCPAGSNASFAPNLPYVGLHFDLHNQWSRGSASEHGLNNGQVNITNYMFWKLHGWIDNVWEKYRVAKGLTTDPAAVTKYNQDLAASCREMDTEIEILKSPPTDPPTFDCPPEADETGEFHEKVRPIFESEANHCASCHGASQTSPYADLTLGGQVSSKCIVERLKRQSNDGGQLDIVKPGDPEHSYLYLKASGTTGTVDCVPKDADHPCNPAVMPPGGKTLTDAELQTLYDWIKNGAN